MKKQPRTAAEVADTPAEPPHDPETPVFLAVVHDLAPAVPTFEPPESHEDFLRRHGVEFDATG